MTIPGPGTAIAISTVVGEFGGCAPHALSEYYRCGPLVGSNNTDVPTSGAIALGDFYCASNAQFTTASGGNSTPTSGNFKSHVFTGPGTFTVNSVGNAAGSSTVDYLVVAGGAGGASGSQFAGGGGGAGGFRTNNPGTTPADGGLPVSATGYPIAVGGGGAENVSGSNSSFSSITSTGGGKGGKGKQLSPGGALSGGSAGS